MPSLLVTPIADVMELVDMLDLGSSAARRGGSTPFIRTLIVKALGNQGLSHLVTTKCVKSVSITKSGKKKEAEIPASFIRYFS